MTGSVRFRTHAKVNLFLKVLGLRPDGFHEIETVLHGISLGDDLDAAPARTGKVEIVMAFDDGLAGRLPPPQENILQAVVAGLVARGARLDGIRIRVLKRVPIGAGLGGGSANAGGAFVILNELLKTNLETAELLELAGEVGSDVPYCILGGTMLATGRGEKLTHLVAPDDLWFVLGISDEPLATADVYARWEELGCNGEKGSAPMTLALGGGDADEIGALLHNDLEIAAFSLRPELEAKKEVFIEAGALGALLSGSGPTVFGLCVTEAEAAKVAAEVKGEFDRVEVVHSQPHCLERLP